jgi:hypothetical protein
MDERCEKFASDASTRPTDTKLIGTLRKFLYRNQEQRLSAASQQALCDACVRHAAAAAAAAAAAGTGAATADVVAAAATGLIEDALAMPFNIFTTGHKKQLLKHLDRLRGVEGGGASAAAARGGGRGGGGGASAASAAASGARSCAVLDVTLDGAIEVMDDDGETARVEEVDECVAAAIREAFGRGDEVRVRAVFGSAAAAKGGGKRGGAAVATARVLGIVER